MITRAFYSEETQKYAAAVDDPLRMATAFAGVRAADDGNNHVCDPWQLSRWFIVADGRNGYSQSNHFGSPGQQGGISILSSQLLANSDFITGAFASGIRQCIKRRVWPAVCERQQWKKRICIPGRCAGFECCNLGGPFSKNYKGSYLINYRYSTLSILNKTGSPRMKALLISGSFV